MKKLYFILPCVFFFLSVWTVDLQAKDSVVQVEGIAGVIGGDVSQAKDKALTDAKVKAVEQVVGVMIDSKAVYRKELFIDSGIYVRSKGFVKKYDIVKEWLGENGLYHTIIKATVSDELLEDELVRLLKKDRVYIIAGSNLKSGTDSLNTILSGRFAEIGYRNVIIPEEETANPRGNGIKADSFNINDARKLGIRHLADVVVFGKSKNEEAGKIREGYYSCQASGSVEVFKVKDRKLLCAVKKESVRGFGSTEERAVEDALANVNREMADYIIKELTPDDKKVVKVIFYGIPSFSSFRKYKNLLSELRWVNGVEEDSNGYNRLKTVFNVKYSEKPGFIASAFENIGELKVLKSDNYEIEVEVKSK